MHWDEFQVQPRHYSLRESISGTRCIYLDPVWQARQNDNAVLSYLTTKWQAPPTFQNRSSILSVRCQNIVGVASLKFAFASYVLKSSRGDNDEVTFCRIWAWMLSPRQWIWTCRKSVVYLSYDMCEKLSSKTYWWQVRIKKLANYALLTYCSVIRWFRALI